MSNDAKKRGLGRGLDALFRDMKKEDQAYAPQNQTPVFISPQPVKRADEMVTASQNLKQPPAEKPAVTAAPAAAGLRKLAVDLLQPGAFQPRRHFDAAAIDELAQSIAEHGILQPLLVRPLPVGNRFEIIAGERRWRAAQKARVHEVPVIIRELSDREALELGLIENLQRSDLSAIEEAEGFQRLIDDFGRTPDDVAKHLGKSRSHVANTLRLLKLPAAVQRMVQDGKISAGHARAIIGAKDAEHLARLIIEKGLSVRDAENLARAGMTGTKTLQKKTKNFTQKDVDILALEQSITRQLGLKTVINHAETGGSITIQYKSLDQLDDVVRRLKKTP
jgi:ParB family chromosome partitioning protein